MTGKEAVVAGATGLIGNAALRHYRQCAQKRVLLRCRID
jgi:hypothetical protein